MKRTVMSLLQATTLLVLVVPMIAAQDRPEGDRPAARYDLPTEIGPGEPREVSVLLDESHLKIATLILRDGAELAPHSASSPATIQVLQGNGVMHVGGEALSLSAGTIVSLAAGQEHDVVPAPASDMLLLVHYLRGTEDVPSVDG